MTTAHHAFACALTCLSLSVHRDEAEWRMLVDCAEEALKRMGGDTDVVAPLIVAFDALRRSSPGAEFAAARLVLDRRLMEFHRARLGRALDLMRSAA